MLFAHRLALALGHADVDGMLAALTTSQLVNWRAYFEMEPFGFLADERRFVSLATICGQGRIPPRAIRYRRPGGQGGRFMSRQEIAEMVKRLYGR